MKTRLTLAAITLLCIGALQAQITQQVTAIQYYFNADPGPGNTGNGDIINITPASDYNASLALSLPGSLNPGIHNLYIRVKDEHNRWSLPQRRSFLITRSFTSTGDIVAYQYYFNTDAGVGVPGTGAVVNVTPGVVFNQPVAIPLPTTLTPGTYNLYFRVQNDLGFWSQADRRTFVVTEALSGDDGLVAYQYYFDTDPGPGVSANGDLASIPLTMDFDSPVMVEIPTDLSPGIHNLYFRVKNALGVWSIAARGTFLIRQDSQEGSDVVAYQYYFNTDPGVNIPGNGAIVQVTPAAQLSQAIPISLPLGLQDGLHNLYFRVQNAHGNWSAPQRRLFHVNNHSGQLVEIVALEFYYDDDPGAGNANPYTITATTDLDEVLDFGVPCLDAGEHYFYLRAKDNFGSWSIIERDTITVESDMAAPVITANGLTLLCTGESVELSVDDIPGVMYQWTESNVDIPGETNPTLLVTTSGSYAVKAICGGVFELSNTIEVNFAPLQTYYLDADGDGFGDAAQSTETCDLPAGYVDNATDCNDSDPTIYPNAPETCNEIDDDCDGAIDEGVQVTFYADADGDGFGDAANSVLGCTAPVGYVADQTDCDDTDSAINPGSTEICNEIDDDCDGLIDEDVQSTFYADADGDGFGDADDTLLACTTPAGYVTDDTDCNDGDANIHPGATEICNGVDDNCDGEADEGFVYSIAADAILSDMGTEICAGAEIELSVSGGQLGTGAAWHWYYGECDGTFLGIGETLLVTPPAGTQQYSVRAEGTCNNSACTSITIQVRTAPVFTECPMEINANNDAGNCNAIVSYTIGTSGDPVPALSYVLSGATEGSGTGTGSGEVFNVGITNVEITAVNSCGSGICTVEVTVADTEPPFIVCPTDIIIPVEIGQWGAHAEWDSPNATDNCYLNSLSTSHNSGDFFNVGTETITYTVYDDAGNSALCSFDVTVEEPDILGEVNVSIFADDIQITNFTPDLNETITIDATVHNFSGVYATSFTCRLINQFDGTIYADSILSGLPAGQSTIVSWTIQTPSVPAFVPMQIVIDQFDDLQESNELDNQAIRPFINGAFSLNAGIEVTAYANPPSVVAGQAISLCGNAQYDGTAVPLIDYSVAGARVKITIQETGQVITGATDANGDFCLNFRTPNVPGLFSFQAEITDFTLIGQSEIVTFSSIAPLVQCPTDLRIKDLELVGAFLCNDPYRRAIGVGSVFTGVVKIQNSCAAITEPTTLFINSPDATPVNQFIEIPPLSPGQIYEALTLPMTFSIPGPTAVAAVVDYNNVISEVSEENNGDALQVQVYPLVPDIIPIKIGGGTPYQCEIFQLELDIFNAGGLETGEFAAYIEIYEGANLLSSHNEVVSSIPGHCTGTVGIPFSPLADVIYSVIVECDISEIVDELSESNNNITRSLSFRKCEADLVLLDCAAFDVKPADINEGETMTISTTIGNEGKVPVLSPFEVHYNVAGANYTTVVNTPLGINETVNVSMDVVAPAPAIGQLTVVADGTNVIPEALESNNSLTDDLCWDFDLTNMRCDSTPAIPTVQVLCHPASIGMAVFNRGLYEASEFYLKFEISGPGLPAGWNSLGDLTYYLANTCVCPWFVKLPVQFIYPESGVYQIRVSADPENAYTECNETNNEIIVSVNVVDAPDYATYSQFIAPSKLNPDANEPITFNVSYKNEGCTGQDSFELRLHINEAPFDSLRVPAVDSAEIATFQVGELWSSGLPGLHIVRAFVDGDNEISESVELNNEATRGIIVGKAPDLALFELSPSSFNPNQGELIQVTAKVTNEGGIGANAFVRFYYLGTLLNEIPIGQIPVNIDIGDTAIVTISWTVQDRFAHVIARVEESDPEEYDLTDNEKRIQLNGLSVDVLTTDIECSGLDIGTVEAIISGGKPPYIIEWSNGYNDPLVEVLAGTYTVSVTEATGSRSISTGVVEVLEYAVMWFADNDGDGFGDPNNAILDCNQPAGYVTNHADCDDTNNHVHPNAIETCNDVDDDCDGLIDDSDAPVSDRIQWHQDSDDDGYAHPNISLLACDQPEGYILLDQDSVDCNDLDTLVNPAAQEVCNMIDDDCDGLTDDDDPSVAAQATWYPDADGDSFGDPANSTLACERPEGYVGTGTDCDDASDDVYPGAPEILDGLDNDCDGQIDEGLTQMSVDIGECETVLFGYAPDECIDVNASIADGTAPYSYAWSTGETTESITVCPEETTTYAVTVTDAIGQVAVDVLTVQVIDIRCGNSNQEKILICHLPPGNPENIQTICVSINALQAHLDHGDLIGMCNPVDPCEEEVQAIVLPGDTDLPEIHAQHTTAGIHGNAGDHLLIHPNPAMHSVDIHASEILERVVVYSPAGSVLLDKKIEASHVTIQVEHLPEGIYFVQAVHADGYLQTGKLVIVK